MMLLFYTGHVIVMKVLKNNYMTSAIRISLYIHFANSYSPLRVFIPHFAYILMDEVQRSKFSCRCVLATSQLQSQKVLVSFYKSEPNVNILLHC
jgi:hypothetical protein